MKTAVVTMVRERHGVRIMAIGDKSVIESLASRSGELADISGVQITRTQQSWRLNQLLPDGDLNRVSKLFRTTELFSGWRYLHELNGLGTVMFQIVESDPFGGLVR